MKSSDWSKPEETAKSGIHVPSTPSVLSIPKNWKVATTTLSSSSFNRQFDLQRHSSSSLASSMSLFQQQAFDLKRLSSSSLVSKLGSPNGLSSNGLSSTRTRLISAQRNTTWDEVSAPKQQPNGTRLNLLELVANNGEPKAHNSTCLSNLFLQGNAAPTRRTSVQRNHTDLQLSLVREEDDLKLSVTSTASQNSAWNQKEATSFVDTFPSRPERHLDTSRMTTSDLEALKHSDPFMYFSIPAVKDATWRHREVDVDSLRACGTVRRKSRSER